MRFEHPRMIESRNRVLKACVERGVAPGIHVIPPNSEDVIRYYKEGYRMIAYSLDITMIQQTCLEGLKLIHRFLNEG